MTKPAAKPKKSPPKGLPWYRYPYVWLLLIIVPLLTLLASVATVYIAVNSSESPAHDSYYKRGMSPNELAPKEQIAKERGLSATLAVTQQQLVITLNQAINDGELQITFQHPTLAKFDFTTPLNPMGDDHLAFYIPRPSNLRDHKWDIFVDSPSQGWRIKGRLLDYEDRITLEPFGQ